MALCLVGFASRGILLADGPLIGGGNGGGNLFIADLVRYLGSGLALAFLEHLLRGCYLRIAVCWVLSTVALDQAIISLIVFWERASAFPLIPEAPLTLKIGELVTRNGFFATNVRCLASSQGQISAHLSQSSLGSTILLSEGLLVGRPHGETLAVLAHELGHWWANDWLRESAWQFGYSIFTGLVWKWLADPSSPASGWPQEGNLPGLVLLSVTELLVSSLRSCGLPLECWLRRRAEFKADAYARTLGFGDGLVSFLRVLALNIKEKQQPSAIDYYWRWGYPTETERISKIVDLRSQ